MSADETPDLLGQSVADLLGTALLLAMVVGAGITSRPRATLVTGAWAST